MTRYEPEVLDEDEDDGTMPANVDLLTEKVVGHRIVSVTSEMRDHRLAEYGRPPVEVTVITLDNGYQVILADTSDCCAFTELQGFFLHPDRVDHLIMGVGTTDQYQTWHIYADLGDVLELTVGWSCGNPFYYGYGFDIEVREIP